MITSANKTRSGVDDFPSETGNPVYYRTYSHRVESGRERWADTCDRVIGDRGSGGLAKLGKLSDENRQLLHRLMSELKTIPAGRLLHVAGRPWFDIPENYYGGYNCTSDNICDWEAFGLILDKAMQGCGTGACLEPKYIDQLPVIQNHLELFVVGLPGEGEWGHRGDPRHKPQTTFDWSDDKSYVRITVGDSRRGWRDSYQRLLELSADPNCPNFIKVEVDLSRVRPKGARLKGFGGVANPTKLPELYPKCAAILNGARGRRLNSQECCLLIDEGAVVVVAGNIRRSAGMRQGASFDELFAGLKKNLWQQDEQGNWRIDPKRDALRMANHTRVFHYKPSRAECIESVRSQYYSGEGAIQWAGEAVKRASVDVLQTPAQQKTFLTLYDQDGPGQAGEYLATCYREVTGAYITPEELSDRMERYKLNPCGEIIFNNNFCDLAEIHLNRISPFNFIEQEEAFRAGGIAVAALLHHEFVDERYARSRSFDPIVGVSFTGLFDFFVTLFGVGWLRWLEAGRPDEWGDTIEYTALGDLWDVAETLLPAILMEDSNPEGLYYWRMSRFYKEIEAAYLRWWRFVAETSVWDYCDRHSLKRPNRCTTIQPSGTKALLTGASPGWHPPKAQRFIRRITFSVSDPVALACRDYGYPVVPSQSDKDENGMLLDDPFDPRTTEWLVEIPVEASWANLPGVDAIDINQISALAQFDFYMQAQVHYVGHNGSATIELREEEIEALGDRIYRAIQNDEGYISACLLSRSNSPYPRLPYEPITKQQYDELSKQAVANRRGDFHTCLTQHDKGEDRFAFDASPGGCDSDKCLFPEYTP